MGNVLVTTSLLPAIKRKYPGCTISWITLKNAYRLLEHNPLVDSVFLWEPESWLRLQAMTFDVVMNIDKSAHAGALIMALKARRKLGYGIDRNGVIIPLTKDAEYNYRLGLDDNLKFRVNDLPNTRLLTEAMGLRYERDEYILRLSREEEMFCDQYRRQVVLGGRADQPAIVGFNTGCSVLYPNKKMTVDQHVILLRQLARNRHVRLVLLGGPEDTERNAQIAALAGIDLVNTPTTEGLRRGLCYVNVCDLIVTGDSFGMHAGIGLRKQIIVWFGVSCHQEIDLFDRGVKLVPEALSCSPCWKRSCPHDLECIQMIDLDRIVAEVETWVANRRV
jgi:heptosyltransferase-2